MPVIAEAEACAEKLARYGRIALARDLYDLTQFAQRQLDEPLIRRLWVLKVWSDVVDDSRGLKPLEPNDVLRYRTEADFQPESIGTLTRPSEPWVGCYGSNVGDTSRNREQSGGPRILVSNQIQRRLSSLLLRLSEKARGVLNLWSAKLAVRLVECAF